MWWVQPDVSAEFFTKYSIRILFFYIHTFLHLIKIAYELYNVRTCFCMRVNMLFAGILPEPKNAPCHRVCHIFVFLFLWTLYNVKGYVADAIDTTIAYHTQAMLTLVVIYNNTSSGYCVLPNICRIYFIISTQEQHFYAFLQSGV